MSVDAHATTHDAHAVRTQDSARTGGLSSLFGAAASVDVVVSEGWIARTIGNAPSQRAFGRYRLGRPLGAGGFGVVYEAFDPVLERQVAIKFVRARRGAGDDVLEREAQALARVEHPNVVPVFDVGRHGDDVFLVMQHIEGETLDAWLAHGRSQRRILEVFAAAGRGLAAVHAAGLSHCDFKPGNVLIGSDGAVRVVDFGLARVSAESTPGDDDDTGPTARPFGTPRYMSPEQHEGRAVDVRTDVYSFALALLEALRGAGPLVGGTASQILRTKLRPDLAASAELPSVSPRIVRALQRALSPSPDDRPASMDALLAAMTPQRRARPARTIAIVGGMALAAGAVLGLGEAWQRSERLACESSAATSRDEVWTSDAEQALREAWRGSDVPYAAATADRVVPMLDARADAWQAVAEEICVAAEVDDTLRDDDLARVQWCLEQQRNTLIAVTTRLRQGEAAAIRGAIASASTLDDADACRDPVALRGLPLPPDDDRVRIFELHAQLAEVAAGVALGGPDVAGLAERGLQDAQALGWPPLIAVAQLHLGRVREHAGNYEDALVLLQAAYFEALRVDAFDVALAAADSLTLLVGVRLARVDEGRQWSRFAQTALARIPDRALVRAAGLQVNRASVAVVAGDLDEARVELRAAVASLRESQGDEHLSVAAALDALGVVEFSSSDHAAAKPLFARALAIRERALGPDHPDVAMTMANLAAAHRALREPEIALALNERALAIRERALGPDHPDVASSLNNLANHYSTIGDHVRAVALLERAVAARRKALGSAHPDVATPIANLAGAQLIGRNYAEASARYTEALEIWRATLGDDHLETTTAIVGLCRTALRAGQLEQAVDRCEQGLSTRRRVGASPSQLAEIRFLLAEALWTAARDRQRARALAEQAYEECGRSAEAPAPCPSAIGQWLNDHPTPT